VFAAAHLQASDGPVPALIVEGHRPADHAAMQAGSHPLRQAAHQTFGEDISCSAVKAQTLRTDEDDGVVIAPRPDYTFLSQRARDVSTLDPPYPDWFLNIFSWAQGDTLTTQDMRM
jgi:hypothetical protein